MTSLEELPGRIDDLALPVSQLREEMRGEFSEMLEMAGELRTRMRELNDETKRHMLAPHDDILSRLTIIQDNANGKTNGRTPRSRQQ